MKSCPFTRGASRRNYLKTTTTERDTSYSGRNGKGEDKSGKTKPYLLLNLIKSYFAVRPRKAIGNY